MKKYSIILFFFLQSFLVQAAVNVRSQAIRSALGSVKLVRSMVGQQTVRVFRAMNAALKNDLGIKRNFMTERRYEAVRRFCLDLEEKKEFQEVAAEMAENVMPLWQEAVRRCDIALLHVLGTCGTSLLKKDKNGSKLLCEAIEKNYCTVVRWLIENAKIDPNEQSKDGKMPLILAIENNGKDIVDVSMVNLLLNQGADVNKAQKDGETPLIAAVSNRKGSLNCVRLLLENGADINARGKELRTALFRAARLAKNGLECVVARDIFIELVRQGADLNLLDSQEHTILHIIALRGNTDLLEELRRLSVKININEIDSQGRAALHTAVERGDSKMVEQLVEDFGADVNIQAYWRVTALSIAESRGDKVIADYLLSHGAIKKINFSRLGITENRIFTATSLFIGLGLLSTFIKTFIN